MALLSSRSTLSTVKLVICLAVLTCVTVLHRKRSGHPAAHQKDSPDNPDHSEDLCSYRKLHAPVVVYNRVPKSGSRTVNAVMQTLAKQSGQFKLHHSRIFHQVALNHSEIDSIAHILFVNSADKPHFYDRHFYFVDFEKHGYRMPLYVNTFREPFKRLVSDYYFRRLTSTVSKDRFSAEEKSQTFEDCVNRKQDACVGGNATNMLLNWFCGQDDVCRTPSDEALARAQTNVRKHYMAVAPTSDIHGFFSVLEFLLPQIFRGSLDLFKTRYTTGINVSRDHPLYVLPSEETEKYVKDTYLKYEYKLYEYLLQHYKLLQLQVAATVCP